MKKLGEVSKKMMTFYANPTQEVYSSISNAVEASSDFIIRTSKKSGTDRLVATFLAKASTKNKFKIVGEGEIFKLAKDIATNNQQNKVAKNQR